MTKGKTQKWLTMLVLGLLIAGVSSVAMANGLEMDKVRHEMAQLKDKDHDHDHDHDRDREKDKDHDKDRDKDDDHKGHDH
jgi:Ni/Co efflux regulator RcnB